MIAIVLNFPGGTLEQYDRVIELMNFKPGGPGGPGLMFHWATGTEDGIQVTDVWASREQFDRFADEQIGPLTQQAGLPAPGLTFHDVHSYLTAG